MISFDDNFIQSGRQDLEKSPSTWIAKKFDVYLLFLLFSIFIIFIIFIFIMTFNWRHWIE